MAAGAILTGGQSRRYGSDKATAIWQGRRFVDHLSVALRAAKLEPIFVVGALPADLPKGTVRAPDEQPGGGPLGAVLSAIHAAHDDVLVVACDQVLLSAETIALILAKAGDGRIVMPVWRGRTQPLCALYPRDTREALEQAYAGGERSVLRAIQSLAVLEVHFPDDLLDLANINTPEDHARYLGSAS